MDRSLEPHRRRQDLRSDRQRDRAIQEYRQAIQTNDNTAGAMNEARHWIQAPYKRPDTDQ